MGGLKKKINKGAESGDCTWTIPSCNVSMQGGMQQPGKCEAMPGGLPCHMLSRITLLDANAFQTENMVSTSPGHLNKFTFDQLLWGRERC